MLRELGGRARLHDLYDDVGSAVYDDLCAADTSEVCEILHLLRGTKGPVLELAAGSGRLTLPGHHHLSVDRALGPVDVCVSSVRVLSADRLETELRAAGLVTRARHTLLGEGLRYRDVPLEVEVEVEVEVG